MSDYKLNFTQLSASLDIEKVITFLGSQITVRKSLQLRCICPLCEDIDRKSLSINISTQLWQCFHCKAMGKDLIALTSQTHEIEPYAAAKLLQQQFHTIPATAGEVRTIPANQKGRTNAPTPFDPEKYRASLDPEHELLAPLNLDPSVLRQIGAGYKANGQKEMRGGLALACRDETGKILGFIGISLDGERVKFPKSFLQTTKRT